MNIRDFKKLQQGVLWTVVLALVVHPVMSLSSLTDVQAEAPVPATTVPATGQSDSSTVNAVAAPWVAEDVTPEVLYLHQDATGNLVAMTDESGQVAWRADVRPFGQGTANPPDHPLRFLDQPRESGIGAEGGLYHLGARYYDPLTGRFLSTDPLPLTDIALEEPQRFNRYAYGLNNPYRYHDSTGLLPLGMVKGLIETMRFDPSAIDNVIENSKTAINNVTRGKFTDEELDTLTNLVIDELDIGDIKAALAFQDIDPTKSPLVLTKEQDIFIEQIFTDLFGTNFWGSQKLKGKQRELVQRARDEFGKAKREGAVKVKK